MRADGLVRELYAPHSAQHAIDGSTSWTGISARLSGPGGYYNIGNAFGLMTGIAIQFIAVDPGASAFDALKAYFAGNSGGFAITIATLIFFLSGEAYHRAWANGFPPDARMNFFGDLLSGLGALALGTGLFSLGEPLMAATAGLLHAAGKFGSAFYRAGASSRANWPFLFRLAVLLSRAPALLLSTLALSQAVSAMAHGGSAMAAASAASLIVCYLLWAKADLLLFNPK
jgi:hypothetical protein